MKVKREVKSRYVKPNHLTTGDIWTEEGKHFVKLYFLLSRLKVINTRKMVEYLNADK